MARAERPIKLPSGREVEVLTPTYGQTIELQKLLAESDLEYQKAALAALAPAVDIGELDKLDLLALVKEVNALVAGRDEEHETEFREHIAAGLSGNPTGRSEALPQLVAYRWCGVLRWTYQEVIDTPMEILPVCLRFGWTHQQLLDTPAQAVRDFQTILNYEKEIAEQNGRS